MSRANHELIGESDGTVSLAYLSTVLNYGQGIGVDLAVQLAAAGLSPAVLEAPDARIPGASYLRLLERLEALTGDPHVGLHAGAQFCPRHYAEMGYVVLTSPIVREAIVQGIRFEALANDIGRTRLEETPDGARMTWQPTRGPLGRHAHELHMATWICFARWLVGEGAIAQRVEFPHPPPPDWREHERIFGCPVLFHAPIHAMHLSLELLARPSLQADAAMQERMMHLAQEKLRQHLAGDADASARVRAFIGANLPHGEVPVAAVAAHLGLPVRTLQRRLQAQGLNYSTLLDDVRRTLAEQHLADPRVSLTQLAMQLGFSEQSAFTHAFKRWTQETPNAWRRRRLAQTQG